jgi:hypothetical protein
MRNIHGIIWKSFTVLGLARCSLLAGGEKGQEKGQEKGLDGGAIIV